MTKAIFTLLYNEEYLPGALVLGISLKKLLQIDPIDVKLGILIDKSKFNEHQLSLLSKFYDVFVNVSPLRSKLLNKLHNDLGRPELDGTFTKIELWSLTDYDRILYLDADTLPNIPVTKSQGSILDLLKVDFPESKILAAPDISFPDIFNSGMFELKPNENDYNNLTKIVKSSHPNISFDGADQGLLNQYFNAQPDWIGELLTSGKQDISSAIDTLSSNWVKLPFLYNVTPSTQYDYLPAYKYFTTSAPGLPLNPTSEKFVTPLFKQPSDMEVTDSTANTLNRYRLSALTYFSAPQVKLIHFIGPYKPWNYSSSDEMYKQWWEVWSDYYNNASINDVISDPSNATDEYVTLTASEPVTVDPKRLLDPANYQNVPGIPASADALWDPSKEPPPASTSSTVNVLSQKLKENMLAFSNVWDKEVETPQSPKPSPKSVEQATSNLGLYKSVEPERVFDETTDYHPFHTITQPVWSKQIPKETTVNERTFANNAISFNQINEKLEKLALIDDKSGFEEIYDSNEEEGEEEDEQILEKIPKLFPWEFRKGNYTPERTFESENI